MNDFQRWNFEEDSDGRLVRCADDHEKGQSCNYNPLTLKEVEEMGSRIAKLQVIQSRYDDLLMQVAKVHPGESRHDTAKRYIRNAEQQDNTARGQSNE